MSENGFKGVILCGGEGKRLRPLTYYFQKTMIPVGKRQKPLLEYIVKLLKHYGVEDIVMLVGYKSEQIINYFEDGSRFGVNISYVKDPEDVKGSGHAILNAYKLGFLDDYRNYLIYYGDILTDMNLGSLMNKHVSNDADSVLAVSTRYRLPVGVVKAEDDKVVEMIEKPWIDLTATIGILTLSKRSFKVLTDLASKYRDLDIMTHLIPTLVQKGLKVLVYKHGGFWYDVGSTEKYEKIDNELVEEIFKDII